MKSVISYLDDPIAQLLDKIDKENEQKYKDELRMPEDHKSTLFFLSFH